MRPRRVSAFPLADEIDRHMETGGWTFAALAAASGLDERTIRRWRTGVTRPSGRKLKLLMDALNLSCEDRVAMLSRRDLLSGIVLVPHLAGHNGTQLLRNNKETSHNEVPSSDELLGVAQQTYKTLGSRDVRLSEVDVLQVRESAKRLAPSRDRSLVLAIATTTAAYCSINRGEYAVAAERCYTADAWAEASGASWCSIWAAAQLVRSLYWLGRYREAMEVASKYISRRSEYVGPCIELAVMAGRAASAAGDPKSSVQMWQLADHLSQSASSSAPVGAPRYASTSMALHKSYCASYRKDTDKALSMALEAKASPHKGVQVASEIEVMRAMAIKGHLVDVHETWVALGPKLNAWPAVTMVTRLSAVVEALDRNASNDARELRHLISQWS